MSSTWLFVLLVLELVVGFGLGWLANEAWRRMDFGARSAEPTRGQPSPPARPSRSPNEKGGQCDRVLAGVAADLTLHAEKLNEFEQLIQSVPPGIPDKAAAVRMTRWVHEVGELNRRLEEALANKVRSLLLWAAGYRELLRDVLSALSGYHREVGQFGELLDRLEDESPSEAFRQAVMQGIEGLLESNRGLEHQLASARRQIAEQGEQIVEQGDRLKVAERDARVDALTKLPNRRAFEETLLTLQVSFERQGGRLALVLIDIDHFKSLNDQHGHTAGDAVLAMLGRILKALGGGPDHVSRFGGEEFALLLPGKALRQAGQVAERCRRQIERASVRFDGRDLNVTVSAGVAEARRGDSSQVLLVRADAALYAAKRAGRNQTHLHDGQDVVPLDESRAPGAPVSEPVEPADYSPPPRTGPS